MGFSVSKEKKEIGKITVIYGEGGLGKSSIIGQAVLEAGDKGLIVSVGEDGITPLKDGESFADLSGVNHLDTVVKKWRATPKQIKEGVEVDGVIELMRWIAKQDFKVVAFDSLSMIMPALEQYCFQAYYLDDPSAHGKQTKTEEELRSKAYGFGKSDLLAYMNKEWNMFISSLQYLRDKGVNVFITSHTATKKGRIITEDLEFDFAFLDLPNNKNYDLGQTLFNCSDLFLYGRRDIVVANNNGRGKAIGGKERVLVTESDAVIRAKARANMPEEIPATWESLKKYI